MLRALRVDYEKVNENLGVLGRHINNASSQFNNVTMSFKKIGKKIDKSREIESGNEKLTV